MSCLAAKTAGSTTNHRVCPTRPNCFWHVHTTGAVSPALRPDPTRRPHHTDRLLPRLLLDRGHERFARLDTGAAQARKGLRRGCRSTSGRSEPPRADRLQRRCCLNWGRINGQSTSSGWLLLVDQTTTLGRRSPTGAFVATQSPGRRASRDRSAAEGLAAAGGQSSMEAIARSTSHRLIRGGVSDARGFTRQRSRASCEVCR